MIYKLNKDNTLLGSYPSNKDGYVPKGFTDVVPSKNVPTGEIQTFDGIEWVTNIDYRGKTYYLVDGGSPITVNTIEQPSSDYAVMHKPAIEGNFLAFDGITWINDVNKENAKVLLDEEILIKKVSLLVKKYGADSKEVQDEIGSLDLDTIKAEADKEMKDSIFFEGNHFKVNYETGWMIQMSENHRKYTDNKKMIKNYYGKIVEVKDTNGLQAKMYPRLVNFEKKKREE